MVQLQQNICHQNDCEHEEDLTERAELSEARDHMLACLEISVFGPFLNCPRLMQAERRCIGSEFT